MHPTPTSIPTCHARPWAGTVLVAAVVVAAAGLGGCRSAVKLDEAPVEVRNARPNTPPPPDTRSSPGPGSSMVAGGAGTAGAAAAPPRTVAPVTVTPPDDGGAVAWPAERVVYFDFDSFAVRPDAKPVIEGHARMLVANKGRRLLLEGHTDERGGREYNLALGQKRAEAVARSLVLLGVAEAQLEPVSFGKERPATQGSDEAAWEKNRRVELKDRR